MNGHPYNVDKWVEGSEGALPSPSFLHSTLALRGQLFDFGQLGVKHACDMACRWSWGVLIIPLWFIRDGLGGPRPLGIQCHQRKLCLLLSVWPMTANCLCPCGLPSLLCFRSDNMGVVTCINSLTSSSLPDLALLHHFVLSCLECNILV